MTSPPPLWAHQQTALDLMDGRREFALLHRMRTGKTRTVLEDYVRVQAAGNVDDLLVIAPAGVYRTWETAIQEHVAEPLRSRLRVFRHDATKGNGKGYIERYRDFLSDRSEPRCLLVNVEAVARPGKARKALNYYLSRSRVYAVLDEATSIKDCNAKRTKFLVEEAAPKATYRRILTGLLTPQGPMDAYSQFEFLRPGILGHHNFWTFRSRYAVLEKIWVPGLPNLPPHHPKAKRHEIKRIVGYKNVDDLKRRIDAHAHRVRLEDCYDMPQKVYQLRHVELTAEQHRIYQDLLNYATAQLDGERHVTATMVLTVMLRLHQVVCGHVKDEEGNSYSIPTHRPAALLELLEQHDGKAIVWASYDADIRAIQRALEEVYGEGSVARFWGGNLQTRDAEERQFQTDPRCRFMIGTPAAGGRGRMWAAANLVCYFSNSASLEGRDQSEERAQAVGKSVPVLYVDLVAPGTVDEKFLQILRDKISVDAALSGAGWRQWVI